MGPDLGPVSDLADTAWACIDKNAKALASMPPYLVGAAPTIDSGWLTNPSPGIYSRWDEFAKQLFWDWQAAGEAFVVATAFYSTGWPARFHVAPPWTVNVEMDGGVRTYSIGRVPLGPKQILHLRYKSSVNDAHGHGPLEAGRASMVNAQVLSRYAASITSTVPPSLLEAPGRCRPTRRRRCVTIGSRNGSPTPGSRPSSRAGSSGRQPSSPPTTWPCSS